MDLSYKDTNFNIGDGVQNNESFVTYTFQNSTIHTSNIIFSTIKTSIVETSTSLPPISSPLTTSIPVSTISPTYFTIIHEPITTLLSYHSTKVERMIHDEEPNNDDIMVSFDDLQFDTDEENLPGDLNMSGKQFKLLNSTINYLLQIQEDTWGRHFVNGIEMEYLLKNQENCFRSLVEIIKRKQAEKLAVHSKSFDYEIQKLRDIAKKFHEIFCSTSYENKRICGSQSC
ncbi:unnamed protein product [Lactuca saligna]|uniref:Uncharacterized protein n=1 Tax=Lactuca saligna TaxID=75948 RepID=A0AA35VBA4_LACSI|nr:unnamed protein product [Lactuca saligna]